MQNCVQKFLFEYITCFYCFQHVDGHYFYIFNWQDGHITDWNNISNDECKTAGNILGRIHAIDPKNVAHQEPELSKINWHVHITGCNS